MTNEEKWINDYIKNIDLKNIEWIKLIENLKESFDRKADDFL